MKKIILILTLTLILGGCSIAQQPPENTNYSQCSSHYTVSCLNTDNADAVNKNIPCSNNNDCSAENMIEYCQPGGPNLLKCIAAKYYCGQDGFCQGCDCPTP